MDINQERKIVDRILGQKKKMDFVAKGNTYEHRLEFRKHGWSWNKTEGLWVIENKCKSDDCIRIFFNIDGIFIEGSK